MRDTFFVLFMLFFRIGMGQDLLTQLKSESEKEKEFIIQTFKGTRVVNGHSVEVKGAKELEFIISHRFGRLNSGVYNAFGLDEAYIRIGLEYGITSRLSVGIGRSRYFKINDSYAKYQLFRQARGGGSPFTVTLFGSTGVMTEPYPTDWNGDNLDFISKLFYTGQMLVARKISNNFSLQFAPTFVHSNRVDRDFEKNNQLALGFGGRCKITPSISINGEYYYRMSPQNTTDRFDSIGLGIDIETGGHVFQLIFSNTQGMIDRAFIGQTEGNFFKGDIHFGFNITRTFQLADKK